MANGQDPLRETVRRDAFGQIRRQAVPRARRIRQRVGAAGLRTSGVGQIPLQEAERIRGAQEGQVEGQIAGQRLGQLGALEQLEKRGDIESRLLRERGDIQRSLLARDARSRLINALLSGGVSAATGFIGRRK